MLKSSFFYDTHEEGKESVGKGSRISLLKHTVPQRAIPLSALEVKSVLVACFFPVNIVVSPSHKTYGEMYFSLEFDFPNGNPKYHTYLHIMTSYIIFPKHPYCSLQRTWKLFKNYCFSLNFTLS